MKLRLVFLFIVVFCRFALGQTVNFSAAEKYSYDSLAKYLPYSSVEPVWIKGSQKFWYRTIVGGISRYILVDAARAKRKDLFDTDILVAKLAKTGINATAANLSVNSLEIDPMDETQLRFSYAGKRLVFNTRTLELRETEKEKPAVSSDKRVRSDLPYWKKVSPDGTYSIYAYKHNLYLEKSQEPGAVALTKDGEQYYSFSSAGNSVADDKKYSASAYWLNRSGKLFALREDKRKVADLAVINSLAKPRPEIVTYKFPMPGDKHVVQYEMFLFDAASEGVKKIDVSKYDDQKIILQQTLVNGRMMLFAGDISSSDRYVYFLRRSRTNDQMDLCRLDALSGKVDELISETCKPHFNDQLFNCRILNNGNDILWWSERSGYGQYYLYDRNGKLKKVLTQERFVAGDILSIDTLKRSFVFEGYGREKDINPYYRMYYRVNFDGSGFTLLTPGNGYHDIRLQQNGKYIVDTYSRVDMPAVTELRNYDGKLILELEKQDISALTAAGWKAPAMLKVKASDGKTDLYGVMYTPFHMNPSKKYPVISNVYPGPQEDYIPKKFSIDDNYNQSLAELGFVVVNVACRGSSPYRGREFHSHSYGNLRDYALADDKYVLEELGRKYSFMDMSRIGIYGHSGGGFMSATALLTYPDFYKVAVAASGNYDSNIYTQWWGETYHGVWKNNDGFVSNIPSTADLAANLKGRLLLITGDMDRNVHMANTLRLADALIKKNKRFDMMVLPGKDHGLGDKYYINLVRYYFLEHLLKHRVNDVDIINHN